MYDAQPTTFIMDSGASIVALIGFALSSTKTIHGIISEICEAPQVVEDAARSLKQALDLLTSITNENGQALPEKFRTAVQEYQKRLEAFEKKLGNLKVESKDGRIQRSLRRVKTVLREKDLERLHKTTYEFTSMVSSYRQGKQL